MMSVGKPVAVNRRSFLVGASAAVGASTTLWPLPARALVQGEPALIDGTWVERQPKRVYSLRPIGNTSAPLFSYFALVSDVSSVQLVNLAQRWHIGSAMQTMPRGDLPVLSAAAPFKAGGPGGPRDYIDVPAGELTLRDVVGLYPYDNLIQAVLITGADVKEWLEMSAGIFNRIEPSKADQPLINEAVPCYNFDVIDGVTYKIDPSRPAKYAPDGGVVDAGASRIVDLAYGGKPIDPAQKFIVATNNFRVAGGGNFPGITYEVSIFFGESTNREVVAAYITAQGTINPSADSNWSLAPVDGASVVFPSGPKAIDYLSDVEGIEYIGNGDGGFADFRLTL